MTMRTIALCVSPLLPLLAGCPYPGQELSVAEELSEAVSTVKLHQTDFDESSNPLLDVPPGSIIDSIELTQGCWGRYLRSTEPLPGIEEERVIEEWGVLCFDFIAETFVEEHLVRMVPPADGVPSSSYIVYQGSLELVSASTVSRHITSGQSGAVKDDGKIEFNYLLALHASISIGVEYSTLITVDDTYMKSSDVCIFEPCSGEVNEGDHWYRLE